MSESCCQPDAAPARTGSGELCDCVISVYRAGRLSDGIVCAAQLGTAGYLFETPAVLVLPIGGYPHSRPPQAESPELAQNKIGAAYKNRGLVDG